MTNFSHAGQNEGFTCILVAYLDTGQGAVIMTNGDRGSGLFNEILRDIAREYGWPDYQPTEKTVADVNPAVYRSYVGEYDANGIRATISTDGEQLFAFASPLGPQRVRLYPSADDRFFWLDQDVDLTFVKDTQGRVTEMRARALASLIEATRQGQGEDRSRLLQDWPRIRPAGSKGKSRSTAMWFKLTAAACRKESTSHSCHLMAREQGASLACSDRSYATRDHQ